jgi:hypothetical protein
LQAFPNLEEVVQDAPWSPATFTSLCQHCPNIQRIEAGEGFQSLQHEDDDKIALSPPLAERFAAIRALARLQSLTQLTFNPDSCVDLSVLARERPAALKVLHLVLNHSHSSSAACVMSLAALRRLQLLVIELPRYANPLRMTPSEVQCMLSALSEGPAVQMLLPDYTARWVQEAVQEVQQLGMQLPRDVTFGEPKRLC